MYFFILLFLFSMQSTITYSSKTKAVARPQSIASTIPVSLDALSKELEDKKDQLIKDNQKLKKVAAQLAKDQKSLRELKENTDKILNLKLMPRTTHVQLFEQLKKSELPESLYHFVICDISPAKEKAYLLLLIKLRTKSFNNLRRTVLSLPNQIDGIQKKIAQEKAKKKK